MPTIVSLGGIHRKGHSVLALLRHDAIYLSPFCREVLRKLIDVTTVIFIADHLNVPESTVFVFCIKLTSKTKTSWYKNKCHFTWVTNVFFMGMFVGCSQTDVSEIHTIYGP